MTSAKVYQGFHDDKMLKSTVLRDRKSWRIEQIDELDEQKCTQNIGILPRSTKK